MSERIALRLQGVSKMYKVFSNRRDRLLDALGMGSSWVGKKPRARAFWSLRDIDLVVPAGRRVGIIGRNGAGKTTLLKLITSATAPTEGKIEVNGTVQALFEAGAGFHPEFTGYENVRASLGYQGLDPQAVEHALEDIADFAELDGFLGQPFKTYSMGMQARLAFATATAIRPDILIVDEVLGAGDAYFQTKSVERLRSLVEDTGATLLLVSHALEQVMRYCDQCLWIERGRIVKQGTSMEVVTAYEAFIRELEDRRLRGRNRVRMSTSAAEGKAEMNDRIEVRLEWRGPPQTGIGVSELTLLRGSETVDVLRIGDVQDADATQLAALILSDGWSEPRRTDQGFCRWLEVGSEQPTASGRASFRTQGWFEPAEYSVRVRLCSSGKGSLALSVALNGQLVGTRGEYTGAKESWSEWTHELGAIRGLISEGAGANEPKVSPEPEPAEGAKRIYRWPSDGSLTLENFFLCDGEDHPKAVFLPGSILRVHFDVRAHRPGTFNVVAGATMARRDGVQITNLISPVFTLELKKDDSRTFRVDLAPLNFGDGYYVFSLSIFERKLVAESRYDLISRSMEFQVSGNEKLPTDWVFKHPCTWTVR